MDTATYATISRELAEAQEQFRALDAMVYEAMDGLTYQAWVADYDATWAKILSLNEMLRNAA